MTWTRDKQSILETAMRNARLERYRIEALLERHASLNRPYLSRRGTRPPPLSP